MDKIDGLTNVTDEIIGLEELQTYLKNGETLNHYIGFEISGLVHLGTGLASGLVVRELQKLGVNTCYFLADWHAWINDKLGGDHDFIKRVGEAYFGPALKVSADIAGANGSLIEMKNGSDLYHANDRYWQNVIDASRNLTLSRMVKSTTIMGRAESESMPFSYLIYPAMQVADIFEMQKNIAHAGTDQRKIHVIAREVAQKLKISPLKDQQGNSIKPIAIHHHLLLGLQKPTIWPLPEGEEKEAMRAQMKMSKSVKGSAIFIHDTPEEIRQKIKDAFCPEKEVEYNPVLDWCEHMIFPIKGSIEIKRDEKFGGNLKAANYDELKEMFASAALHPVDLKNNVAEILIEMLEPARKMFESQESQDLIKEIRERQSR